MVTFVIFNYLFIKKNNKNISSFVCAGRIRPELVQGIRDMLIRIEEIALFFYTPQDIDDIVKIAALAKFYGFQPHIQIEIFIALFDLFIQLESGRIIERLSNELHALSEMSNLLAEDLADRYARWKPTLPRAFPMLFGRIVNMKIRASTFDDAQAIVLRNLKNAKPITVKPEMYYPSHPKKVFETFRDLLKKKLSSTTLDRFTVVWSENNRMNIYMLDILAITDNAMTALNKFKDIEDTQNYQIVSMSFIAIRDMIGQIAAPIEKRNIKVLKEFSIKFSELPHVNDKTVTELINSRDFKKPHFYVDYEKNINCPEIMQRCVSAVENLFIKITEILKYFDKKDMTVFKLEFKSIIEKLMDVENVVLRKSEINV